VTRSKAQTILRELTQQGLLERQLIGGGEYAHSPIGQTIAAPTRT